MLWHRWLISFFIIIYCANAETGGLEGELFLYKEGVKNYKYGSYYEAIDTFLKISKNPASPYYLNSLLYLAKVYLQVGKRSGIKKYFWIAVNYINIYASKIKDLNWDYYYTKASIFEMLGFYEKALANYKISLFKAKKDYEEVKSIIGALRVAVWEKRVDLVTKYMVLLNMAHLKSEDKKEVEFIKGMKLFFEEKYKRAFEIFLRTYKEFEFFLIENPNYYLYVAETAYRNNLIKLSERLFRRILTLVKNKEVNRKVLLRIGDVLLKKGAVKEAISYYFRLISKYPSFNESTVAKLKLIYLMGYDKTLKKKLKKYFEESPFLQNPKKFVVEVLVKNRNSYLGRFAISNFGSLVFRYKSDKLFKRLNWEISLLSVDRMDYEQKEYIKMLWSSYLLAIEPERICELYLSNKRFFRKIFEDKILIKVAKDLNICKKYKKEIELLNYVVSKWQKDENLIVLAKSYYKKKFFKKAIEVLEKIKNRGCDFYRLYAKSLIMMEIPDKKISKMSFKKCKDFETFIASVYKEQDVSLGFVKKNGLKIAKLSKKSDITKKFLFKLAKALIQKEEYEKLIYLLQPYAAVDKKECFLNSILAISYIRSGKMVYAKEVIKNISECSEKWAKVAINIYESEKLIKRAKNERSF